MPTTRLAPTPTLAAQLAPLPAPPPGRAPGRQGQALEAMRRGIAYEAAGLTPHAAGAFAQAVALDPSNGLARRRHAAALVADNRADEACALWMGLAAEAPADPDPLLHLCHALAVAGREGEAFARLGLAVQAWPGDARPVALAGLLLLRVGRLQPALDALMMAHRTRPDLVPVLTGLALAHLRRQEWGPACRFARAAWRAAGDYETGANLSRILVENGSFTEAEEVALATMRLHPWPHAAASNHALALEGQRRHAEARAAWEALSALMPRATDVWHNLAQLRLKQGELAPEVWDIYERRLSYRRFGPTRWLGEPIAGRTVILHSEGGFGDTIQYARYAPMVKAAGARRVILGIQPNLVRLLRHVPGVDAVAGITPTTLAPPHDLILPLLSMMKLFGTTMQTIPPPLDLSADYPPPPRPGDGRLRVGLVWTGNPEFVNNPKRSIHPALLRGLIGVPGTEFHSLQFGLDRLPAGLPINNLVRGVGDFADTAALVAGLDLVIAVDTSTAHLAACLGKPVWMLSRYLGCWRWFEGRRDSPWYPTMRLYRQTHPTDWTPVLAELEADLRQVAAAPAALRPSLMLEVPGRPLARAA